GCGKGCLRRRVCAGRGYRGIGDKSVYSGLARQIAVIMHSDDCPARIVLLGIEHAPVRKKPEIGLACGAVDLPDLAPGRKIARASEISRELRSIDLIVVDPDI